MTYQSIVLPRMYTSACTGSCTHLHVYVFFFPCIHHICFYLCACFLRYFYLRVLTYSEGLLSISIYQSKKIPISKYQPIYHSYCTVSMSSSIPMNPPICLSLCIHLHFCLHKSIYMSISVSPSISQHR
jgi:hypothetical protein